MSMPVQDPMSVILDVLLNLRVKQDWDTRLFLSSPKRNRYIITFGEKRRLIEFEGGFVRIERLEEEPVFQYETIVEDGPNTAATILSCF